MQGGEMTKEIGIVEKQKARPNDMKYIQVIDPCSKAKITAICKPPAEGSHYTFWHCISTDTWGLTIKLVEKSASGKTNETAWKVTWVYSNDKGIFYAAVTSRSLLKDTTIQGADAESLKEFFEIYKRG
jgi:hypothetical protein